MSVASLRLRAAPQQGHHPGQGECTRAVNDLVRFSSRAATAVSSVTAGAAALELVLINQGEGAVPIYQLQLRKVGSEAPPSDLGVYRVTSAGYPILRWWSRGRWESDPEKPDQQHLNPESLENHFTWMVSNPDSRLVLLVSYFQQEMSSSQS